MKLDYTLVWRPLFLYATCLVVRGPQVVWATGHESGVGYVALVDRVDRFIYVATNNMVNRIF